MNTLKLNISLLLALMLLNACGDSDSSDPVNNVPDPDNPTVATCDIINHGNDSQAELNETQELIALEELYANFETFVRDNDRDALTDMLMDTSTPLFITGKEVSGITKTRLNGAGFVTNVVNSSGLELRISNTDFTVFKGAAVSWADYTQVNNSSTTATGVDLFFYIKTSEGWKLATTNNTYVLPGDNTDYEAKNPMLEAPSVTLSEFITAFNDKNKDDMYAAFKGNSTFIVLSAVLSEDYSQSIHTSNAFIDCMSEDENSYTLTITNEQVEIQDQYLAEVIADYSITLDNSEVESGKMVLTMIGTPTDGWLISAGAMTY